MDTVSSGLGTVYTQFCFLWETGLEWITDICYKVRCGCDHFSRHHHWDCTGSANGIVILVMFTPCCCTLYLTYYYFVCFSRGINRAYCFEVAHNSTSRIAWHHKVSITEAAWMKSTLNISNRSEMARLESFVKDLRRTHNHILAAPLF